RRALGLPAAYPGAQAARAGALVRRRARLAATRSGVEGLDRPRRRALVRRALARHRARARAGAAQPALVHLPRALRAGRAALLAAGPAALGRRSPGGDRAPAAGGR